MKNLKPRTRPTAAEALAVAAETAPMLPPAQVSAEHRPDRPTTLNLRFRETSVAAIMETAKARGLTIKQVIATALAKEGVPLAAIDLEDGTPRRGASRKRSSSVYS
jgi:hypothetical protein